jgi:hypothetical protein
MTSFQTEDGDVSLLPRTGKTRLKLNGGFTRQMSNSSVLYFKAAHQWGLDG